MLEEFDNIYFFFKGRGVRVFFPTCPSNGKLLVKTMYLSAFPYFEAEMLRRGYTVCFISHQSRWAPDEETHLTAEFVRFVTAKLNMEPKCIPVGFSCGGLQAVRLAELYPELISVLFLDAPVLNILSLAGLGACRPKDAVVFWSELVKTYGFTKSTLINFRKSAIDYMEPLIENNIPIVMLYGDADDVVPYEENGQVLEDYYKENGGDLCVIRMPGRWHHPHSLEDPTPIIEQVEARLR